MAGVDKKISELTVKAVPVVADSFVIVDSGTAETKRVTGFDQKLGTADTVEFIDIVVTNQNFNNGILHTDVSGNLLSGPTTVTVDTDKFTFTRGSAAITLDNHNLSIDGSGTSLMTLAGDLIITGDLTVESASVINQDVTTDGTPTFGGLSLTTALSEAQGGTGESTYVDGQILIGHTSGNGLAKNTIAGTADQITVTNAPATITLSTPQDIGTSSTPTFAGATLTSTTEALTVPRMTTAQKNALTAVKGMIVYDTTLDKIQGYEGAVAAWVSFV